MLRPLRRGEIVRHAGHHLIAWVTDPVPLGFALHRQAAPLHRAHVPLRGDDLTEIGLPAGAWVIDTSALRGVVGDTHATCGALLIARIEQTIRRAAIACAIEEASWQSSGQS